MQSDKARKKTSVSSATSAQTMVSNSSTTSASTTRSLSSVVTALTAATTVSPSTSPNMSANKPRHVSQVLVTDEGGRVVSTATYSTPSSRSTSPPSTNVDVPSSGVCVDADFSGRIPGSYPLSSDPPSPLPVIPCVSPIDMPQRVRSQWK